MANAGVRLTIVSIIVPLVLEVEKKAKAFVGGASIGASARLFDNVIYWKEEKRRRRSSSEIAFARSKETLTIGVSVDAPASQALRSASAWAS